ncbi:MAG TPA: hypothetical protein VFU43_25225 [Streptosporangiaceae bacterium]|nr:hypothetical protein [Streptosporangiaceae bacterium]
MPEPTPLELTLKLRAEHEAGTLDPDNLQTRRELHRLGAAMLSDCSSWDAPLLGPEDVSFKDAYQAAMDIIVIPPELEEAIERAGGRERVRAMLLDAISPEATGAPPKGSQAAPGTQAAPTHERRSETPPETGERPS